MINKINFQNNSRYNIAFGLNLNNQKMINALCENPKDKAAIIRQFDMEDPDIQPCFDIFSKMIKENYDNCSAMNAIIQKLDTLNINTENRNGLIECLSNFLNNWEKLFLSIRTNVVTVLDKVGIKHPAAGHLSRTVTNPLYRDIAIKNIEDANKYMLSTIKPGQCPDKDFLIAIHKIITKDLDFHAPNGISYPPKDYAGIVEQSAEDKLLLKPEKKGLAERLDSFMEWLQRNYNKDDVFLLGAQSYKKLLGISPFYDGSGRAMRIFIDALLYSRGYRFKQYPANYAEVRSLPMDDLRNLFVENCEKIAD